MRTGRKKGFTLIEVCLVMLIFGIAVTSLMALFPPSLRQGSMAVSDSVLTSFGDAVMNAIAGRASAMQLTEDWEDFWQNEAAFKREVLAGLTVDTSGSMLGGDNDKLQLGEHTVKDYLGIGKISDNKKSGQITIKYKLEIAPVDESKYGKRLYRAILHVTDNEYADVVRAGSVFVTYMFYCGEVM